jgi:hypothetical protein
LTEQREKRIPFTEFEEATEETDTTEERETEIMLAFKCSAPDALPRRED